MYYTGVDYSGLGENGEFIEGSIIANGAPEYGDSADDNALESLMSRTQSPVIGASFVSIGGLTPGKTYNIYVLAANNTSTLDLPSRYYLFQDTPADGGELLDSAFDVNLNQVQGSSAGTGVVIRLQGVATDSGALSFATNADGETQRGYASGLIVTEAPVAPGTVIIGGVDTGVTDATTPGGELVSELIAELSWKNHGQYVSAITALLKQLVANGTLTKAEADTIHQVAAQSDIGKKVH